MNIFRTISFIPKCDFEKNPWQGKICVESQHYDFEIVPKNPFWFFSELAEKMWFDRVCEYNIGTDEFTLSVRKTTHECYLLRITYNSHAEHDYYLTNHDIADFKKASANVVLMLMSRINDINDIKKMTVMNDVDVDRMMEYYSSKEKIKKIRELAEYPLPDFE